MCERPDLDQVFAQTLIDRGLDPKEVVDFLVSPAGRALTVHDLLRGLEADSSAAGRRDLA